MIIIGLKRSCKEIFVELHGYVEHLDHHKAGTEKNVTSIEECQRLCFSDYRCLAIEYCTDLKECHLYEKVFYNDPYEKRRGQHLYCNYYVLQCGKFCYIYIYIYIYIYYGFKTNPILYKVLINLIFRPM